MLKILKVNFKKVRKLISLELPRKVDVKLKLYKLKSFTDFQIISPLYLIDFELIGLPGF